MKFVYSFLAGVAVGLLLLFINGRCDRVNNYADSLLNPEKEIKVIHDTIKVIETRIGHRETTRVKWKQGADRIVYVTKFDTLATVDTVLIELVKCDSVAKYRDSALVACDSTVKDLERVVSLKTRESEIRAGSEAEAKKEAKKAKRQLFWTRVAAGVAAVIALVAAVGS